MANLFTGQTPTLADNSDGAPGITTATNVHFSQSGTVTGIRFYATTTVGGTYSVHLYRADAADTPSPAGTLLASKTLSGPPTAGTWNSVAFDTPVLVTTGVLYRAALFSGAGRYVATLMFFNVPLTNGDIIAEANNNDPVGIGTIRQGSFAISATPAYPSGAGNGACYFVDVEFTAGAAPATITPNSLTLASALGQPAIALPRALAGSVSASVRLGVPTVTTPAPEPGASTNGGWNTLRAIALANRERARLDRERDRNPIDCPDHGWPLDRSSRGLHCAFGGHIVKGS